MPSYNVKNYYKGETIFQEGSSSSAAYLIKSGSIRIVKTADGKTVNLVTLKAGQIFGEMGVISEGSRTATAIASEFTELVVITRDALKQYLKSSPPVIQALINSFINRLESTSKKISDSSTTSTFTSICNIIDMVRAETPETMSPASPPQSASHAKPLNYSKLSGKIKEIISVTQYEIDAAIKKLDSANIISIQSDSGRIRTLQILDPRRFLQNAIKFHKEFEGDIDSILQATEYIDIEEFSKIVKSTPDMIYKKIGAGEIPENIFYIHSFAAAQWINEVGIDYFKRVKRRRIDIDNIEAIHDIIFVDNNTLQEAFSIIGHYKLGMLAAIADDEAKKKILDNVSSNVAKIIQEESPSIKQIDEIEAGDIEEEFITLIKDLKRPKTSGANK